MERTVRRSMRLAKNNRRKERNRAAAKRLRSPIERNRGRMSVGEVMGLSPATSYAVNLSEARILYILLYRTWDFTYMVLLMICV